MIRLCAAVWRLLRRIVVLTLALGVLGMVAAAALAWRLSQGPMEIGWVARQIEAARNGPDALTRIAIGQATIGWAGFVDGAGQGLDLQIRDMRLTDSRGDDVATAAQIDLTLSMARLLLGQIVPRVVAVTGLETRLTRDAMGDVALDLGGFDLGEDNPGEPAPSLAETLAELARPIRRDGRPARAGLQHLEQLRSLRIEASSLHLQDPALGGTWRLGIDKLDLRRQPDGGVRGAASATLALGSTQASLTVTADLAPGGGTAIQLAVAPISATAMQQAAPTLAAGVGDVAGRATVLDAAVQASATLFLDTAMRPTKAALHMDAGTGRLALAGGAIGFDSLAVDLDATWTHPAWTRPQRLALQRARAVLHAPGGAWPTTVNAAATVDFEPMGLAGTAELTLDHLAFADLPALWPERTSKDVRPWITQNITAGTARDGSLKIAFAAAPDLSGFKLTAIDGSLRAEATTIHWLRPAPPIEQAQGVITIKTPDVMDIAIASARQGAMQLKNGAIRIVGLTVKDQFMAIGAEAAGAVPELLTLLRHPRLDLLSRKPIPMRNPAGSFSGRLSINLPLNHDLEFEDVRIQTNVRLSDLRLGGIVAGRDLERGDIQMDVNSDTLKASGAAIVAGVQSEIQLDMDFRNGPGSQIVQRAQAVGRATARQLAAAGFDPGPLMPSGTALVTAKWAQRRDGAGDLQINANLLAAELTLAGWRKPPGQPGEATAKLVVRGDQLQIIDPVHAQASGMLMDGRVELVGGRPLLLTMDRLALGPTQARGQVRFPATPNEPIRATLQGPVFDLSPELARKPGPARPPEAGAPWIADVRFDRVLLAGERGVAGVAAHIENDGRRVTALTATSSGPERVELTIKPESPGRRLALRSADGGALLRAADLLDTVEGGRLTLDGLYDDRTATSPLTGAAEMKDFSVRNGRLLGKLLQAVTIYGMLDALNGPGLAFSDLVMPFRWDGAALDITDARAFSASLGVTVKGRIDTDRKSLDLQGTLVPAYVLNSLLGRIPLLGNLFRAEQGGGLVAMNYTMRGPAADPTVIVNPLSALTPGFLRGLFKIFE